MTEQSDQAAHLKELLEERLSEVADFRHSLTNETDRGCALLAASYLDAELKQIVIDRLVDDPQVAEDMARPSGPLGSFSARIDFVYLLGLIGPTARRDLHLIRKVRNEFGHSAKPITFEEPSIAARCQEAQLTYLNSDADPRRRFVTSVLGVTAQLHIARFRSEHISPATDRIPTEEVKAEFSEIADRVLRELFGIEPDG